MVIWTTCQARRTVRASLTGIETGFTFHYPWIIVAKLTITILGHTVYADSKVDSLIACITDRRRHNTCLTTVMAFGTLLYSHIYIPYHTVTQVIVDIWGSEFSTVASTTFEQFIAR